MLIRTNQSERRSVERRNVYPNRPNDAERNAEPRGVGLRLRNLAGTGVRRR